METHESKKNEYCAVHKNKAKNLPKLLENSLKLIIVIFSVLQFLLNLTFGIDGDRGYFLQASTYRSFFSKPAASALGLVRER